MKRTCALLLIAIMTCSNCAARGPSLARQRITESPDLWRMYAEKLPIGSVVRIGTSDGDRFSASLLVVDGTGITVKTRTRLAEAPRHIAFDQLDQLEIEPQNGGPGARAGAIAVGIGTGVGAFFGTLLLMCVAGAGGCGG